MSENHLLKCRLISSCILVQFVVSALFLSSLFYFVAIVLVICALASWEWGKLSGFSRYSDRFLITIFYSFMLILVSFFMQKYCDNICYSVVVFFLCISLLWWIIALFLVISYPFSAKIWCNSKSLRLIFGLFSILLFLEGMILLRIFRYNANHYSGILWTLYIMILVWGIDTGSYVFGKLFGKHKLAHKVSPEKTWQGFIGGLFTAAIFLYIYRSLVKIDATPLGLIICSVPSALAAVLGDLTESMFKRELKIKDSGHLIPGHGGVLDRIDSLMAAVPIFSSLLILVCEEI